jgi:hypothetical protein
VRDSQEDFIWFQRRNVLGHFLDFAVVEAEDGIGSRRVGGGHGGYWVGWDGIGVSGLVW